MSNESLRESPPHRALAERIKELNCLYGISNLLENQDVSLPWIMQRAVELIPAAWQYPENACARIRLDGQEYRSRGFIETRWLQSAAISLNGVRIGAVDVYYRDVPAEEDSPFLEEEARLLKAIGERLSKVFWLKKSEEALRESEERSRVLTEQVTEGVALVQNGLFCYINPAFHTLFTLVSPDGLVGSPARLPEGAGDELTQIYADVDERSLKSKTQQAHQLTRAGKTCWLYVCHSPIMLKGQPAVLSTFKDITEIKEQQLAAQQRAEQLDLENKMLRASLKDRYRLGGLIGSSAPMQQVYELILKASATDASVAIFGESGTGKELVAQAIHEHSARKAQRFVAVNCGAIQESLFEREFFGHRKGAFSSAHADSPGYLDLAAGGTLFLDEVGELTVTMQAKLLRAIEGGGYRPVGSADASSADFRIVSASNAALVEKVCKGEMRKDFFYRIQVIQIQLPPPASAQAGYPAAGGAFLERHGLPGKEENPGACAGQPDGLRLARQCPRIAECAATVRDARPIGVPCARSSAWRCPGGVGTGSSRGGPGPGADLDFQSPPGGGRQSDARC